MPVSPRPLQMKLRGISLTLDLLVSTLALCSASITFYPKLETSVCPWSDWKCKEKKTGSKSACVLYKENNCSAYLPMEYLDFYQTLKGLSCYSESSSDCLTEPMLLMDTSFDPQWCPWQSWQPWSFVCLDAVLKQHSWLREAKIKHREPRDATLWLRLRSRSCRCPNGRHGSQCSGSGHQAAFTPLASDLSVNGKLTVPTRRQSAWCPWSAWSGDCDCSTPRAKQWKMWAVRRMRTCRIGASTADDCPGSASETLTCQCDLDSSSSSKWSMEFFNKPFFLILAILIGLMLFFCCACRANCKNRRGQQQSQQPQQRQQQELLLNSVPQAARPISPSAPAAPAPGNPLNAPPPSYEEAIKLVA